MIAAHKFNPDSNIHDSAEIITKALKGLKPKIAVILGSGLGSLANKVQAPVEIPYTDLPGFPRPGVEGHAGKLIAGTIEDVPVIFLKGRVHFYEGGNADPVRVMIRTLKSVGIDTMFLSNAAGSLRAEAGAGGLIAIADHINLMFSNPLTGPNDERWGPRFVAMDNAWDKDLRATLIASAKTIGVPMIEGVYCAFLGPTFETPAEIRMAKVMGADSVGMSTVPECIIARHCGMKVVGCSAITNMAAGMGEESLSHEQTLEWAAVAGEKLSRVVMQFLKDWQAGRV